LPALTLLARGKVRDIYSIPNVDDALLFVATDRISSFDIIMKNVRTCFPFPQTPTRTRRAHSFFSPPSSFHFLSLQGIPNKGKLLTQLSLFFFDHLANAPETKHIPNHVITSSIDEMPEVVKQYRDQLEGRTILVRKAQILPVEAIVRGYITGSSLLFLPSRREKGTNRSSFFRLHRLRLVRVPEERYDARHQAP
jgi:phosphoribosylaminoimidazole-succinocarboxamide synthase